MKQFQFAEQSVLNLRQQEKRIAEAAVMRAGRAVVEIQRQMESLQQWLLAAMQALTTKPTTDSNAVSRNASAAGHWRYLRSIQTCQAQLAQMNDQLEASENALERSRESLQNAEITVKTLETLKAARYADHRRMYQAKQQQLSDESTMRMWLRQKQEAVTDD